MPDFYFQVTKERDFRSHQQGDIHHLFRVIKIIPITGTSGYFKQETWIDFVMFLAVVMVFKSLYISPFLPL